MHHYSYQDGLGASNKTSLSLGLCLEPCGGLGRGAVSYERDTPEEVSSGAAGGDEEEGLFQHLPRREPPAEGLGLQLLYRNVQWFRGELVFKARRLLYDSTLGLRAIQKKMRMSRAQGVQGYLAHKKTPPPP